MSIKEKPSGMTKGMDLFYTYKILKDLTTDFKDMYPHELGLIDDDGKRLKKAKSTEEKKAMTFYNRMIINMKRLLGKFGLKSRFATFAAASLLLRENKNYFNLSEDDKIEQLNEGIEMFKQTKDFKDFREDAPANATGTAVAGTGDDSSVVPVKKKKKKKGINNVAMIKRVLYDMERKKNGSNKT